MKAESHDRDAQAALVANESQGEMHTAPAHATPDEPVTRDQPASGHHVGHDMPAHAQDVGSPGHDKHTGHSVGMFRDKFWWALALTLPTLVWGHMLPSAFGYAPPSFPGSRLIPATFGTLLFVFGGAPFLKGAVREIRDRLPGMMTLIALAISVAFVFSWVVTLGFPGMPLWEELATLITVMLLGHWLEMRSISQAQGALGELAKLLPDMATRVARAADGSEQLEDVSVNDLGIGNIMLVRPGASVPADGVVRDGRSSVDEALLPGSRRRC